MTNKKKYSFSEGLYSIAQISSSPLFDCSQPGDRETLNVGGADDEEAVKNNGAV